MFVDYSVAYSLVRKQLSARITLKTVDIFHKGQRICSHMRSNRKGKHTTLKDHMPKNHQTYLEWTPAWPINWAEQTGTATSKLVASIMESVSSTAGIPPCLPWSDEAYEGVWSTTIRGVISVN